ncbi:MAG: hypothetical protein XE11_1497 [Methanomicrobiales archaeon 53_19]|jgi:hypothetical protein|uniref:hypothetical protein n=1 Tax=Methanocalculus sp. TaxID=2004547 RepID=UPI000747BD0D|nr:hypothetical protein [Methanocalculus sp.]KUK69800.1 MAG: hypothetical protein XD88_1050 [Methanocalculus sp. 52_23]KUL03025.1 MAG: hypothetical protein XE11_1497 [Methanomicrobiales archaeon 53_19]HIJ06206.1 hypothetical protein [Methanocalculus sp.]
MDARMKFLEHELEEKERELKMVKREEEPVHTATADEDERIAALERKVRELDALLKGVTAEMLDLKSVTRKLARNLEDQEIRGGDTASAVSLQKEPRSRSRIVPDEEPVRVRERHPSPPPPATPGPEAEPPVDTSDMELIMQPDGTLKHEKRNRNDYIVASSGYAPVTKMKKGKIESKIYEAPDVDPKSGVVISGKEKDDDTSPKTIQRKK